MKNIIDLKVMNSTADCPKVCVPVTSLSFIHSSGLSLILKYSLSAYYVPGTVLDSGLQASTRLTKSLSSGHRKREKNKSHNFNKSHDNTYVL